MIILLKCWKCTNKLFLLFIIEVCFLQIYFTNHWYIGMVLIIKITWFLRAIYLINSPTSMISSLWESLSAIALLIIDGGLFNQVKCTKNHVITIIIIITWLVIHFTWLATCMSWLIMNQGGCYKALTPSKNMLLPSERPAK